MAELPRRPQRGDDILTAFNALREFVRKNRLLSVSGGRLSQVEGGVTLSINRSPYLAPTIAFGCTSVGLVVTVTPGKVYFKGVSKTITDWPTDGEVTLTETTYAWIGMSLTNGTATWHAGATDPGDGDDDTEIFRIFVATVADGNITELLECQHGDIHCLGNA
jgi:hypothetical protein